jgi:FtsP/CotA-like multicopper oxidase with cupredoxin domain
MPAGPANHARRRFLQAVAGVAAGATIPQLGSCGDATTMPSTPGARAPLPTPAAYAIADLALVAAPAGGGWGGAAGSTWRYNGLLPGPTLLTRRGSQARIQLLNQLPEPTIVHWHGALVPDAADGHPRSAVPPGAGYRYEFPVVQRAATLWYHPHPHHATAGQVHRGLVGFLLVGDEEEDALALPSGPREVLLLLQDRDDDPARAFEYAPTEADLQDGLLRGTPFGNAVPLPTLTVSRARYRFRILNGSHARVYHLALGDGSPLTVIGNDGGLLPAPVGIASAWLGVGERLDLLLDFADRALGARVMLSSLPFDAAGGEGPARQGIGMDLLELVVAPGEGRVDQPLPAVLSAVPGLGAPAAERIFELRSEHAAGRHLINGLSYDVHRVDERIPLGQTERWIFRNDSGLPHPVHLHGTQFQIESRSGGRNEVFPWEAGWKDTALLMPLETVSVLVRFEHHRGVFPLHCHNLQHEDQGMMLNVEVT